MKGGASGWLTVLPLREEGYDMSATQIRDQLAIRYHHEPSGLPASCDGCGAPFSLQYGLDCAKGWLVKKGHNDLCDSDARIADVGWGGVAIEPILVPENDKQGRPMLQADWMVRGVWEVNRVAFFDNASLMPMHLHVVIPEPTFRGRAFLHRLHPPRRASTV